MTLPNTSNVSRPRALGFGCRIDDGYYRLAVTPKTPLDIVTAPLQAPVVNTTAEAEDFSNEFGQMFSRAQFAGGAGLAFAHLGSTSRSAFSARATSLDDSRFWDSEGVDVQAPAPGEPGKITLLAPTANIETSADSNLFLAYDGTTLLMLENTTGRTSTDFASAVPTFSTITPWNVGGDSALTVLDVTTIGTDMFFACGANGIHKRVVAGTLTSIGTAATDRVWGVKRQLLSSTGAALDSVALGTGVHTNLVTLGTGKVWNDVCDAGAAVLACGSDGAIYALAFTTAGATGGVLEIKAQTQTNVGEVPTAVCSDGANVFFATSEATPSGAIGRWYRADLATDLTLANAVLLRQWGDQAATRDCAPRAIRATRDAVFVGVQEPDGRCFLWRYDRATTGIARHLSLGTGGVVVDLLAASGRLFATMAAAGLRRETVGSYEASGWLIGPLADFFTATDKSWAGALLDADPVDDGQRIRFFYTSDPEALEDNTSAAWIEAKNVSSGSDGSETPLPNVQSRYLAGMVRLYANGDVTATPSVRSFSFRAYPGDGDIQISLPVVASDTFERPHVRRQRVSGLGDEIYASLKGREGTYAEVELFRPAELLRGVIEQVGTRVEALAASGTAVDVCQLKFRGRRVSMAATAVTSSTGGFGEIGVMGIGEAA